jgi:hypothetical protein
MLTVTHTNRTADRAGLITTITISTLITDVVIRIHWRLP